jgi:PRTRC genetic system protein A
MHILAPHIACVVRENEFSQAINAYTDVYVLTNAGTILLHKKLSHGRHVRVEVDRIPGYEVKPEEMVIPIRQELNFLPNGRIPFHLLTQIIQFFKDVMTIKKADQEAMAHILWNAEKQHEGDKGYFIGIPDQVVSKASARYEFNHIKKGDIIVVDIHSHNTMGAFFSGTDDADDKKGINLAGVVGKLDEKEPALVWRMNINEVKIKVSMEDIFDVPKREVNVPSEWLEKVKTFSQVHPKGSYDFGRGFGNGRGFPDMGKNFPVAGQGRRHGSGERSIGTNLPLDLGGMPNGAEWLAGLTDELFSDALDVDAIGIDGSTGRIVTPDDLTPSQLAALGIRRGQDFEGDGLPLLNDMDAVLTVEYGEDAVEARDQIEAWLEALDEADEILFDLMKQMYAKMSSKGQQQFDKSGLV